MNGKGGDYELLQEVAGHVKLKDCATCQKHSPFANAMEILHQISIASSTQNDAPKRLHLKMLEDVPQHGMSVPYGIYVGVKKPGVSGSTICDMKLLMINKTNCTGLTVTTSRIWVSLKF